MAAYSTTPLIKKLGIKEHMSLLILHEPENYFKLLGPLPKGVLTKPGGAMFDFIHYFAISKGELDGMFGFLLKSLMHSGMLWISWPKSPKGTSYKVAAGSEVVSDLHENSIREIGLSHGLVDVKVCAIDDTWSGLKFVYRLKDRRD